MLITIYSGNIVVLKSGVELLRGERTTTTSWAAMLGKITSSSCASVCSSSSPLVS